MIEPIIELIALSRDLLWARKELDKEYFHNFIQPIWDTFLKVHENYKESFSHYISELSKDTYNAQDLIDQIRKDSILTFDLRSNFSSIQLQQWREQQNKKRRDLLEVFAFELYLYFNFLDFIKIDKDRENFQLSYIIDSEAKSPSSRRLRKDIGNKQVEKIISSVLEKPVEDNQSALNKIIKTNILNYQIDPHWNYPRFRAIIVLSRNPDDRLKVKDYFTLIIKDIQNNYQKVSKAYFRLRGAFLE